jgi:hypothetical protein
MDDVCRGGFGDMHSLWRRGFVRRERTTFATGMPVSLAVSMLAHPWSPFGRSPQLPLSLTQGSAVSLNDGYRSLWVGGDTTFSGLARKVMDP